MFKLVLEKAEEPGIKLPTSTGSWKKQESSRKTSISALLTMPKPLTVWITINCGADLMGFCSLSRAPGTWPLILPPVREIPAKTLSSQERLLLSDGLGHPLREGAEGTGL